MAALHSGGTTRKPAEAGKSGMACLRSDSHFWATINYIHHNPVKHGHVTRWDEWPFSSAAEYLKEVGREEAIRIWKSYPILDYGKGWDDAQPYVV
jgi:hypothetical protein